MKPSAAPTSIADLLASLSEPVRLRVLRLLEVEELSVGEVAKAVQLPQSTVSRHLKILAEQGWVARRSVGTATFYRLVLDDLSPLQRPLWVAVRTPMTGSAAELDEDDRRLRAVLAERRLDSQAFFGRLAGEWDALRARLFGAGFTAPGLLALLRPDWVVADLGCGTGNAAELLAPHVAQVIAVDSNDAMLTAAQRRLAGVGNVRFASAELSALPLKDASVDAVVLALVLHHLERPAAALAEARRVLRAGRGGGVALVIDMAAHGREEYRQELGHRHLGFSPDDLAGLFREAGFAGAVRVTPLPGDAEAKGPGLLAATARLDDPER